MALRKLKQAGITGIALLALVALVAGGSAWFSGEALGHQTDEVDLELVDDWEERPQLIFDKTVETYGLPDELTPTRAIWFNPGPWKRIILRREGVNHNFPKPHVDHLKSTVDYFVPADDYSALAKYDGSLLLDRTPGEMSARCDFEFANFLAVNLADDIVTRKRSVDEARLFYHSLLVDQGGNFDTFSEEQIAYATGLLFEPFDGAFPDGPVGDHAHGNDGNPVFPDGR